MVKTTSYRVLARNYRPTTFDDLVGQEVLVRTFRNAIEIGRIPHAFILTGVRGVGKTTTARLIARSLNCVGPDGQSTPTVRPCGVCEHCKAIGSDSHIDVIEVDAASHTGVANIREIIDNVRYRPVSARYKVYVIDEVHMLSTAAFNALLKTLEEPPPHIIFVLATTEIRKVPVTVLSRCQRFDLRRLDNNQMVDHLSSIAAKESVSIDQESLLLITRSAEGSVRDGLSLLDQAISFCGEEIKEIEVRGMLGLAGRSEIIDLFEALVSGKPEQALNISHKQYMLGVDPIVIVQDLMEFCHWLTRIKVTKESTRDITIPENEWFRGTEISRTISVAELTRVWQMLVKGLGEVQRAAAGLPALEMVIIRIAFAADLPDPASLVRLSQKNQGGDSNNSRLRDGDASKRSPSKESTKNSLKRSLAENGSSTEEVESQKEKDIPSVSKNLDTFFDLVDLAEKNDEYVLRSHLISSVHLVNFKHGQISLRLKDSAPEYFVQRLSNFLSDVTGNRWLISLSSEKGEPTIKEKKDQVVAQRIAHAEEHPLVRRALESFPGSHIKSVRSFSVSEEQSGTISDQEEISNEKS